MDVAIYVAWVVMIFALPWAAICLLAATFAHVAAGRDTTLAPFAVYLERASLALFVIGILALQIWEMLLKAARDFSL